MTELTISNGRIVLHGYPEGTKLVGINHPTKLQQETGALSAAAGEMSRLREFQSDLARAVDWARTALANDTVESVKDACAIASVIKFRGCFDGTSGLRRRPLSVKAIFDASDRELVERIRLLRNKMAAHDEQRVTGHFAFVVVGPDASAIEASNLSMTVPVAHMPDFVPLERLATQALRWVDSECERAGQQIVRTFNAMPFETRVFIVTTYPEFTLQIAESDVLRDAPN